jgi:hypothetical protein
MLKETFLFKSLMGHGDIFENMILMLKIVMDLLHT